MSKLRTNTDREYYKTIYQDGQGPWTGLKSIDEQTDRWLESGAVRTPEHPSALDVGCGTGRITSLFANHGWNAVGIDNLRKPLRRASQNHGPFRTHYLQADAFQLPFPNSHFLGLIDYGLLHHVRKQEWVIYRNQVLSRLQPGGYYFVSVFHETDEHANRSQKRWVHHKGHYDRFFTRDTLDDFLGSAFNRLDSTLHRDDAHRFLHALYRREQEPTAPDE